MRRQARELAFCCIFEYLFTSLECRIDEGLFEKAKLSKDDTEFAFNLYKGTIANLDNYFELISKYSKGFRLERVYKVDLASIAMCMYELSTDTPVAVCINEAVDLAKKYSTEKSVKYVNGILAEHVRATANGGKPA